MWSVCRTIGLNWFGPDALWGLSDLTNRLLQRSAFVAFGCMDRVGMVRCIPGHLALEVFCELRSLSVREIRG